MSYCEVRSGSQWERASSGLGKMVRQPQREDLRPETSAWLASFLERHLFIVPSRCPRSESMGSRRGHMGNLNGSVINPVYLNVVGGASKWFNSTYCSCNDLGSIPRTHISLQPPITPVIGSLMPSDLLLKELYGNGAICKLEPKS